MTTLREKIKPILDSICAKTIGDHCPYDYNCEKEDCDMESMTEVLQAFKEWLGEVELPSFYDGKEYHEYPPIEQNQFVLKGQQDTIKAIQDAIEGVKPR